MARAKLKPKRAAKVRAQTRVSQAKRARPARARKAAPARPPQRFVVSHLREEDFATAGLRRYARYRDLGMADGTNGMVTARVIRFVPPCDPREVAKLHHHEVDFQMVYVLKGWLDTEIGGHGTIRMQTGSAWMQPPRIAHRILDYSDDCEVLEIVLPADFATVEHE
jgi:quercetin dioxygenase-like cupin family protein